VEREKRERGGRNKKYYKYYYKLYDERGDKKEQKVKVLFWVQISKLRMFLGI
jgi:hypothetical protein